MVNLDVQPSYASLSRVAARRGDHWHLWSHLLKSHFKSFRFLLLKISNPIFWNHTLDGIFFYFSDISDCIFWNNLSLKGIFFFLSRSRNISNHILWNHTLKGSFSSSQDEETAFDEKNCVHWHLPGHLLKLTLLKIKSWCWHQY